MDKATQIDEEMDKVAESLEDLSKSENPEPIDSEEGMEALVKAIQTMSPGALRAKKHLLTDSQKVVFVKALKKARDLTAAAQMDDNKKPQKTREPVTEEVSNSAEGVDEADEKLMQAENAGQRHQGGQDGNQGPGEWQGEVVKSEETPEGEALAKSEDVSEESEKQPENIQKSAKEEHFDGQDQLQKSGLLKEMIKRMRERGMDRDKCLEAMKKKGYDHTIAKAYWEGSETEPSTEPVKKSMTVLVWEDPQKKLLSASTRRGQNCHFDTADQILQDEQEYNDFRKSGNVYRQELTDEELNKSNATPRKIDINEVIEKGGDFTESRLRTARENMGFKHPGKFTVQSVDNDYIAKSMGLSQEEADKILGKSKAPETNAESSELFAKGKGEGSRGGKVVGHTKDGKPIYAGKNAKLGPHKHTLQDVRDIKHHDKDALHHAVRYFAQEHRNMTVGEHAAFKGTIQDKARKMGLTPKHLHEMSSKPSAAEKIREGIEYNYQLDQQRKKARKEKQQTQTGKKHYVKDKDKKIHTFDNKDDALKFHREHNKKHGPFSSDYGNDDDGFPEANNMKKT